MKYLIVIEETATGHSAYSPDVAGCVAAASSRDEVEREMREALEFHLSGMNRDGLELPQPRTSASYVDVQDLGSDRVENC